MKSRRRKRNSSEWKRNINAAKRLKGEEYVGHRGKVYEAVQEGPACNCKRKCFTAIDEMKREALMHKFYNIPDFTSQRFFLANCIKYKTPPRKYGSGVKKRSVIYEYNVTIQSQVFLICKQALESMLGLKIAKINYVCDLLKANDHPIEDRRGKLTRPIKLPNAKRQEVLDFVFKVPKYRSHYTRRHNPHRYFLSPELTQRKLFDLYVKDCVQEQWNHHHFGCSVKLL